MSIFSRSLRKITTFGAPQSFPYSRRTMSVDVSYKLYSRGYCPFTQMVRVALNHTNTPYTFTKDGQAPDWFAAASPDNSVPAMKLPDGTLTNSSVKMIRLAKGADALLIEGAQEWEEKVRMNVVGPFVKVMSSPNPMIQAEERPKLIRGIKMITEHLESRTTGPWFLGSTYSSVDVVLSPVLHRVPLLKYFRGLDISNSTLTAYTTVLESHPPFASVAYPLEQLKKAFIMGLPKQKPMSIGRLQHIAIRAQYDKCVALHDEVASASTYEAGAKIARELSRRAITLTLLIAKHAGFEENVVYPVFEEIQSGATARAHHEHEHDGPVLQEFEDMYTTAAQSIPNGGDLELIKAAYAPLRAKMAAWREEMIAHMDGEEKELMSLTFQLGDKEIPLFKNIYKCISDENEKLVPFVLEFLSPQERMQYMHNLSIAVGEDAEQWKVVGKYVTDNMREGDVKDLAERLPVFAKALA
ncbi:hypothetical protein BJ742DRAFT_801842 [Cladochytrium replicatum]|nr:hypothetical protein BJ742DRAFT_801842 [Cladochytrium replicatum]